MLTSKDNILSELVTLLGIENRFKSEKQNIYNDLGLDSIDATEALIMIEERYHIEISDEDANRLFVHGNLGDLADYINNMCMAFTPA